MKKTILAAFVMMFISLSLIGCGNDHNNVTPTIVTTILSDPTFDGDILFTPPSTFTITQDNNIPSVFAGVDPNTFEESRAFLDFPLSGPNGVPGNAIIVSATLDIFIDNVFLQLPGDTIPILIDLVSFSTLTVSDFNSTSPVTATVFPPISSADFRQHVSVNVTSLMVEAQNSLLPDFQVRILKDPGTLIPGLIEIDEGLSLSTLAPRLTVQYF